jgi:hypothetical protein
MKTLVAVMLGTGMLVFGDSSQLSVPLGFVHMGDASRYTHEETPLERTPSLLSATALTDVVKEYCVRCHSQRRMTGNLTLEDFDVPSAPQHAETGEKMILKLRAGMMPPPGASRPAGDTLQMLAETLETLIDEDWALHPNPGNRSFQRLNRAEYEYSVRELLALDIDAGDYLPLDMKSANFDNIADAQLLSPTLMDAYMRSADEVARLAVGVTDASATSITYTNPSYAAQWERVPGAPRGTRGGLSVVHNFPADGEYDFEMWFEHTTTGEFYGNVTPGEQIELSIDGERMALVEIDRWMHTSDPNGASQDIDPIFVRAGPHRVSAAFIQVEDGPVEDLLSPHEWSLVDRKIGTGAYGVTAWAHLKDLAIIGPINPTGVSETPSRQAIFSCRPTSLEEERPCAVEIVSRLANKAFRHTVSDVVLDAYMGLYDDRVAVDGFEVGVRTALQGILASPDFVFRLEQAPPSGVAPGGMYRISDHDLASRLSFFLWGAPPDDVLLGLAEQEVLSDREVLEGQVSRMLSDPRAEALGSRFAAQWLRLEDLERVNPDRLMFPDFHQQLKDAMRRETEMLFNSIVAEDRSVFDLYSADYTFVNERLAKHYGIMGVTGEEFRRVEYPDETRSGIMGHASILTLTSHAGRTSPVLRGKWVMEVILGTPPPPPPPNVPSLEDSTDDAKDGRLLTTGERMAKHRENPTCNACHRFMDPIGLALDNFDPTGQWRIRENDVPVDTNTEFYDGTKMGSLMDLQGAILDRSEPVVRNFTRNLMAYALGRRVEYYDMPTVRRIVRQAEAEDYRMSKFIVGVVESEAFQMRRTALATQDVEGRER